MSMRNIFADAAISLSELRKRPQAYFTDHAIAVTCNNRPIGYVIGAEAYEHLMAILRQSQQVNTFKGRFWLTAARLREIAEGVTRPVAASLPVDLSMAFYVSACLVGTGYTSFPMNLV